MSLLGLASSLVLRLRQVVYAVVKSHRIDGTKSISAIHLRQASSPCGVTRVWVGPNSRGPKAPSGRRMSAQISVLLSHPFRIRTLGRRGRDKYRPPSRGSIAVIGKSREI